MRVEVLPQVSLSSIGTVRVGDALNRAIAEPGMTRFRFAVAYMRLSGLDRLGAAMDHLLNRGGQVSGAIGINDEITSLEALEGLLQISSDSTIFYTVSGFIYHPKLYIVNGSDRATVIVGSANLTRDGLFRNVEVAALVHLSLRSSRDQDAYSRFDTVMSELLNTSHANVQPLTDVLLGVLKDADRIKSEAQVAEPGPPLRPRRSRSAPVPEVLSTLFPAMRIPVAPPAVRRARPMSRPAPAVPSSVPPTLAVGTDFTFLLQLSSFDSSHRSGVPGTPEVLIPHAAIGFFPAISSSGHKYPDVYFDATLNTPMGREIHQYRLWYYELRPNGSRIDEYRLRLDRDTIDLSTRGGGDLLIVSRVAVAAGVNYEMTVLPQTDPTFPTYLALCTREVQGKRWGLV